MGDDYPELFRCFMCLKYYPIENLVEVSVRDFLFKKQVCSECFGKVKFGTSGYSGGELAKENSKK